MNGTAAYLGLGAVRSQAGFILRSFLVQFNIRRFIEMHVSLWTQERDQAIFLSVFSIHLSESEI